MRQREIFSSDEAKNAGNTGCIPEAFCEIWRKKIRCPRQCLFNQDFPSINVTVFVQIHEKLLRNFDLNLKLCHILTPFDIFRFDICVIMC
jgi:hypothetical protein